MNRDLEEEKVMVYESYTVYINALQFGSLERATSLLSHGCSLFDGNTSLVVTKADVLLLGTRTLDVLGESKDTDEEDGSASSKDGRRGTFLGADVRVWVVVANAAGGSPLLLGSDGVVLKTVNELGERDVRLVAERVVGLEIVVGAVLEFDPQEVTVLRRGSAAELKGEGRNEVGDTSKFWVRLVHLEHVEEGNEGVVGGLDQQELERVTVESDAFE